MPVLRENGKFVGGMIRNVRRRTVNMEESCQLLMEERMLIIRHISNSLQGLDSFWLVKVQVLESAKFCAIEQLGAGR